MNRLFLHRVLGPVQVADGHHAQHDAVVVHHRQVAHAAVAHRLSGGVLINMGSIVSYRAVPLQGTYSASKHAVKAYTDTLRMELEHDGVPIAVTLALIVATIKGSLVACYFMHLISEKKLIYAVLVLTAAFFVALMALPIFTHSNGYWIH